MRVRGYNKESVLKLMNDYDEKEMKKFKLSLRLVKNYFPQYYSQFRDTVWNDNDIINSLWMANQSHSSFADNLFQTLLRNYHYHHITSAVRFVSKDKAEYKMYAKMLSKR